jgi:hypothetical protein
MCTFSYIFFSASGTRLQAIYVGPWQRRIVPLVINYEHLTKNEVGQVHS